MISLRFWIVRQWWLLSRHRKEVVWWAAFAVSLAVTCATLGLLIGIYWGHK
jgi:hypothetical protein